MVVAGRLSRATARVVLLLLLLPAGTSAVVAAERGALGLRLQHEGMVWRIVAIVPEGPADRAGLRVGELVIQVNNVLMPSEDQLRRMITGLEPGDTARVVIIREDGTVDFRLTAEILPDRGDGASP